MSGFKDIAKGGWHPKGKDGGKESWRGDFKGINQIATKFGHGKSDSKALDAAHNHQSTPLSALKDPSSFGPPPKNIHFHGGAAMPNAITPDKRGWGASQSGSQAPLQIQSSQQIEQRQEQQRTAPVAAPRTVPATPARSQPAIQPRHQVQQQQAEEEEEGPRAPVPYRADTTGFQTQGLPKPPMRHTELPTEEPQRLPGYVRPTPKAAPKATPAAPTRQITSPLPRHQGSPSATAKPQPPPRLPPRQNSNPHEYTPAPPPAYTPSVETGQPQTNGYINQSAAKRLGQAGINVSGFGIGQGAGRGGGEGQGKGASETTGGGGAPAVGQLAELQSRFSRMPGMSSPASSTSPAAAAKPPATQGGTTWAQKQQALQTAAAFQKDPSSISFKDAKDAASTANNFNQRHGAQIAAGWSAAQKFGASAAAAVPQARPALGSAASSSSNVNEMAAAVAAKKKPPPPPKKKDFLVDQAVVSEEPPPIPLASRPR